ncbi:MAG: hypothetical protein ACTHKS_13350 [Gaiellaceae bacterium]
MRKAFRAAGLLAVTAALAAGVADAASGPTATISSPTAGQKVSIHHTPYLAVAGTAAFATPAAETTRFFLRRDGCGTSSDNPHLSLTSGTDGGDGCGLILNAVVGLGGDVDQGAFVDFPATDGMPLALDASRSISGTIDITGTGAGAVEVDVSLEGLVGGQGVPVGSTTTTTVLDPTVSDNPVAFTMQPDASLAGADLQGLDLRVHIHGPALDAGFIGLSGKSSVDVPSFTASVNRSVDVSLDDPTFANAVAGRLSGTTWSVAVPTPAVGAHTVYVRATQGFDTGATTSRSFTVTK